MSGPAMPAPVSPLAGVLPPPVARAAAGAALVLVDASLQPRYGCKGPGAMAWLAEQGLPLPAAPNQWLALSSGGRILRLGRSEFLIESDAARIAALYAAPRAPAVYPVLRQDACMVLHGPGLPALLRQTCNINFAALDLALAPVVLTSMVGVSVTVLPERTDSGEIGYRLWCDGSFGPYLWRTLWAIAGELGGGALGHEAVL